MTVRNNFVARFHAGSLKDTSQLLWTFELGIAADQDFPREIHCAGNVALAFAVARRCGAVTFRFADIDDCYAWLVQILLHCFDLCDYVGSRMRSQLSFREFRRCGGDRSSFLAPRRHAAIEIR